MRRLPGATAPGAKRARLPAARPVCRIQNGGEVIAHLGKVHWASHELVEQAGQLPSLDRTEPCAQERHFPQLEPVRGMIRFDLEGDDEPVGTGLVVHASSIARDPLPRRPLPWLEASQRLVATSDPVPEAPFHDTDVVSQNADFLKMGN